MRNRFLVWAMTVGAIAVPAMASAIITDADIMISEINYDPVGTDNSTTQEYIEILNNSGVTQDISGMKVKAGIFPEFVFPAGTLVPSKGNVIIAGNKPEFVASNHGGVDPAIVYDFFGPQTSCLANSTALITLTLSGDVTPFDTVTYTRTAPWPDDANGLGANNTGRSIELVNAAADNNDGSNWKLSEGLRGSPGKRNQASIDTAITGGQRDIEYPGPAAAITISATVLTSNSLSSVQLFVDSGSGYAPVAMTDGGSGNYSKQIGPFANKTLIKYYIKATDSTGAEITYPDLAPGTPVAFHVDDDPADGTDLLIHEIMNNPQGSDNNTNSEFIEIYNLRSTPIDLSYFVWGRGLVDTYRRFIPEGTTIAGNGYIVLAGRKELLVSNQGVASELAVDASWTTSVSVLAQGGSTVAIGHANAFEWNDLPTVPIDEVVFLAGSGGWPTIVDGGSMELVARNTDNSVAANWAASTTIPGGTPAATNSTSQVDAWSMY